MQPPRPAAAALTAGAAAGTHMCTELCAAPAARAAAADGELLRQTPRKSPRKISWSTPKRRPDLVASRTTASFFRRGAWWAHPKKEPLASQIGVFFFWGGRQLFGALMAQGLGSSPCGGFSTRFSTAGATSTMTCLGTRGSPHRTHSLKQCKRRARPSPGRKLQVQAVRAG